MKLLNLNKKTFLSFILFVFFTPLFSEDSVDIWKKEDLKKSKNLKSDIITVEQKQSKININTSGPKEIQINRSNLETGKNSIYGIFDPEENNLTLDMWVNSEGTRVKDTIERINKIKLSLFAEEIFLNTLFTSSNLPKKNMKEEEFINYKLDWLVDREQDELITIFLNKNNTFPNKKKIIRYLVDKNIAKANLKEACQKITLINNDIKDSYLDQFKIICLIDNNKKNEAQLFLDLLREQKLTNKFFDNKIDFILELTKKENKKIDDSNLLNFYLSSVSISDFNYTPNKKTDKRIWQYLTASNLIRIDDFTSKEQIKELEIAANDNKFEKSYILEIYKNEKFNFNDFLNIDEVYKNLETTSSRALVYQKFLLSDNIESKLKYLFLLNDLFKKDNLTNIFKEYLDRELKILDINNIPQEYEKLVAENIIYEKNNTLGKIKYNDSKYHTSRIIRFYTEKNISKNKTIKELKNVHKKIKKNKKYKISLKDIILFEALKSDGFTIPKEIDYQKLKNDNLPPKELLNLAKNSETGLLLLRIVELIGEDEILDLDSQTIYFISHLFIKSGIKKFSDKIIFASLPERIEN